MFRDAAYNRPVSMRFVSPVTSRHLKLLVLLLPLFLARSMLPIGFMVSFDAGIPQIVFCPSATAPIDSTSNDPHAMHAQHGHEHHHDAASTDSSSAEQSHQTCPFAFAAAAPLSAFVVFAPEPPAAETIASAINSDIRVVTFRAHPIRGPPSLS